MISCLGKLIAASLGLLATTVVWADDEDVPDVFFLEFLGTWNQSDELWQEYYDSLPDADMELAEIANLPERKDEDDDS